MNARRMRAGREAAREGRTKASRPNRIVYACKNGDCTVLRMWMMGEIWECHVIGWNGLELETWLRGFVVREDYRRVLAIKEQEERGGEVFWFRGYHEWTTDQVLTQLREQRRFAA